MPKAGETDRWPPKANEMPDLTGLKPNVLNVLLNTTLGGAGPLDRNARALWLNYVRVVDQMLWEYNAAREALQLYIDTPNNTISPLFRAIAHMESCVNTMRRAILFARRMRNHKESPAIDKRTVLSGNAGDRLVGIRNAIEHLENSILNDEIAEGEPTTLIVQSDRIELLGHEIMYDELADWATQLHALSTDLINYREPKKAT